MQEREPAQEPGPVEVEVDSLEDNILLIMSDTQVVVVDLVLWLFVISMVEYLQKQLVVQLHHTTVKLFTFSKTLGHLLQQVETLQIVR